MDVVVLAGGFGTRLRPLTEGRVKPLLRILDKTLLERVVEVVPEAVSYTHLTLPTICSV